jgi:hypothetical protein
MSKPSVDAEEVGGDDAQHPINGWREYLTSALRENPLQEGAGEKKQLGDKTY